ERIAGLAQQVAGGDDPAAFTEQAAAWLKLDLPRGAFTRRPLHWPLVFPEVFEDGGFDAIIGNPPFLGGQKLTGALGTAYREHLVHAIGRGARGSADLVAYFVLRAHGLLHTRSEEHTSELQSREKLVCRLLLEKRKTKALSAITHIHS